MLFILDNKQNTVGVASNSNPYSLPYFNDWHTENLEGVNTYEFAIPSEHSDAGLIQVEGHVIIRNLDGENLLFTIKEVNDSHDNGKKIKNVFCEETAITELLSDVQRPATFTSTTLEAVARTVIANTYGWELGAFPYTDSYDVEFTEYTSVLEALRSLMSQYGKEMYFTVELNGTKIVKKIINIVDERGTKTNVRFDYSYDLRGVSRTEDSSKIVTALVGVGKGDNSSERINLSKLAGFVDGDFYKENGADWIGSYSALTQFGKNGRHRFGVFVDDKSDTPEELKRRTIKELESRIIPDVHYGASVTTLERLTGYEAKKVRLGDTIMVNDKSFEPAIVINGRVLELKRSYTRDNVDEVNLGKYKPVTLSPNIMIRDLQNIISKSQEQWQKSGLTLTVEALGGTTFKNGSGSTTLKAKIFEAGLEMDKDGTVYTYKWFKYNKDGQLITLWGGSVDYRTGKTLPVSSLDVDTSATFLCVVDGIGQGQITVFEVSDGADGERGEQGIQGVQGPKGADGTTYYTWIKYADTPTTGMSDVPDGKTYMGIAYNKLTQVESTNYADYSWSLIKGEQGVKGADGTTTYTWVKYADTETGTGMSDSPTGKRFLGLAYNKTTQTESTNPADYSWSPLYDNVKVGGRNLYLDSYLKRSVSYNSAGTLTQTPDAPSNLIRMDWVGTGVNFGFTQGTGDRYIRYETGKEYTISFDIRGNVTNMTYTYLMRMDGANTSFGTQPVTINETTFTRVKFTRTSTFTTEQGYVLIGSTDGATGKWFEVKNVQIEQGNVATDWTPAFEDVQELIGEVDGKVAGVIENNTAKIIETVVYSQDLDSILSNKANVEDISDMATGEQLTGAMNDTVKYIDGRLDGEGGVIASINDVSSALERTANSINAKFTSSGGINLIRNSIGYADFDFWTKSGSMTTIQNAELEQLGFGSGFFCAKGQTGYIEQKVSIQPRNPDGTLRKHSLSFWLKKTIDNATNGWALVDVYANSVKILSVGKGTGAGTTAGWELGIGQFETSYSEVTIRVTVGANSEAYFSGLMLNVGEDALQWQHANGEVYNTNVQFNLNGIKVINSQTKGYTIMSPQEFSGYAEVLDDNNIPQMTRVFTLNGATTEVTELDVDNRIKMKSIVMRNIETAENKGWAFIADE